MSIHIINTKNSLRNYNYLIACDKTYKAAVIDPLKADACLKLAHDHGYEIELIINTHEHWDHIGGNNEILANTNAKILAHYKAKNKIENISQTLHGGEIIDIGTSIKLKVLDTPGHTMANVCLLLSSISETDALFSGDTLFNAGCGNCYNGGCPQAMYQSFKTKLFPLKKNTRIYPGHDYMENNLKFALSREPDNENIKQLLGKLKEKKEIVITTIEQEKKINPFFRLQEKSIINKLIAEGRIVLNATEEEIFVGLRNCRNEW